MKLLYIGDIMARYGREVAQEVLPQVREEHEPDIMLAQAENVTHGSGMSVKHMHELQELGIDGFMSGNHIFAREDLLPLLSKPSEPVTRPANYPAGTRGLPYKFLSTSQGKILLVSLMGQIVGKDADEPMDNPLKVIDELLETYASQAVAAVVNFHGDYSSEKVVIGQYLDGRVAAVIGDHWHVPTADARVLAGGTAHITDVGMVGSRDSSLGVKTEVIVKRWRGEGQGRNELAEDGAYQFGAVVVDIDTATGLARNIQHVLRTGRSGV